MNKEQSKNLILNVINEINMSAPEKQQINLDNKKGLTKIDSLQLINFMIGLEEKIEKDFNKVILISIDDNNSGETFVDSLESLDKLADFIISKIS
jgi:hypothetical protein